MKNDIIIEYIQDELMGTPFIIQGYINNLNIVKAKWEVLPLWKKLFTNKENFFKRTFIEMEMLSVINSKKVSIPRINNE